MFRIELIDYEDGQSGGDLPRGPRDQSIKSNRDDDSKRISHLVKVDL